MSSIEKVCAFLLFLWLLFMLYLIFNAGWVMGRITGRNEMLILQMDRTSAQIQDTIKRLENR